MRVDPRLLGILGAAAIVGTGGCRPGDILTVPPPAGVVASGALGNVGGAEAEYVAAKGQVFAGIAGSFGAGVMMWGELLSDEFVYSGFTGLGGSYANIDARMTVGGRGFSEGASPPFAQLLAARSALLVVLPALAQYEPASGQSKVGEAYALTGYAELFLAEDYCAGVTLDQVIPGGGIQYGTPLTTDSLLGRAAAHFDSAKARAAGDASVLALAAVGLGRTLLDRNQYADAATAVTNVPASFVYNAEMGSPSTGSSGSSGWFSSTIYGYAYGYPYGSAFRYFNMADTEGGNGLDYRSAGDPRLVIDSSLITSDGGTWYFPEKFEANFADLPMATGIEAALIQAEAALQGGDSHGWLTDLNVLRTSGPSVTGADTTWLAGSGGVAGLPPLSDPVSDSARVSLTFRERAFWLFGTGSRLGDLRRLIRQYGRDQSTVFPIGAYANGNNPGLPLPIPQYGLDVSLTLPTPASGITEPNPSYKGCLASTTTA